MRKILLVDDDLYLRDVYKEVFVEDGFEVDIAIDGKDGLKKIMEGGYDLILLDIMMPYLDGLGILNILKDRKPKKTNGPIVVLTNLAQDLIMEEAQNNGALICLNKSNYNPDQLLIKIKELLK